MNLRVYRFTFTFPNFPSGLGVYQTEENHQKMSAPPVGFPTEKKMSVAMTKDTFLKGSGRPRISERRILQLQRKGHEPII